MPTPAPSPVPEGMSTITAHLNFNGDCRKAIDSYQEALGAEVLGDPVPSPDGTGICSPPVAASLEDAFLLIDNDDLRRALTAAFGCCARTTCSASCNGEMAVR